MPSSRERVAEVRERRPFVDHLVRTVQHYGLVKGSELAGAVTFFGFLSFFPVLALAFAAVGWISSVYDLAGELEEAISSVLPGMIGDGEGQISLADFENAAASVAGLGAIGLLYTGLGWISAMRDALLVVFEKPPAEQPNFVIGKLKDLVSLILIGVVMIVSVGVAGMIGSLSERILDWLNLGSELGWLLDGISVVVGLGANMVLFYALFRLLANPSTPSRSLWSGALLGAIGFEVLKKVAFFLIGATKDQPAFAVFGVALVLLVWINYFSRVVMYCAAWAHTSPAARAQREREALEAERRELEMKELAQVELRETAPAGGRISARAAFAAGGLSTLGAVALLRRRSGGGGSRTRG